MIAEVSLLLEKFDNLENLLFDFGELSGQLSSADLELIDETQIILNARENIITQIKILKPEITEIIDKQSTEKAASIRKMLIGETVMADFSEDEKAVQVKIINIRSLQNEIMKKEVGNQMRYKRKYEEVRGELENLQKEKKKLNFYQQTTRVADGGTGRKGGQFDSQN
ncbi:MAG: hypothetical protein LBC86_05565 [Oscillospiraceae bacterium]|jgi:hypothetical protein|nr:hypothetical protein [Oscillospiraceae bacterium]